MHTIYFEEDLINHPRAQEILKRFPNAHRVACDYYGEVFNPKAQNFRLQKEKPALILAKKTGSLVLPAPSEYAIGGTRNFYFSHMLNCPYDCRYCFLQGMYRSAHYVLFVNYEDFQDAILKKISEFPGEEIYFFSGYDCDSLAFETVTKFLESFLPFFESHPNAYLELRTKSAQVSSLLSRKPIQNCIAAFSLAPEKINRSLESKTPSIEARLQSIKALQMSGWKIGLRFDPVIYCKDYEGGYAQLFKRAFEMVDVNRLHSVSLGLFRLPKPIYETVYRLYPDEKLFAGPIEEQNGMCSYPKELEHQIYEFCLKELSRYVPAQKTFSCLG